MTSEGEHPGRSGNDHLRFPIPSTIPTSSTPALQTAQLAVWVEAWKRHLAEDDPS